MVLSKVGGRLSVKKKEQIRRFFANPKKSFRLVRTIKHLARTGKKDNVIGHSQWGTPVVYSVLIQGKRRAVKISDAENFARKALEQVLSQHAKAVKTGFISARHYKLDGVKYDYADFNVGIMEHAKGISPNLLMCGPGRFTPPASKKIFEEFVKKNPSFKSELLSDAIRELDKNLAKLKVSGKIKTFDTEGSNSNLVVRGIDKRTGKFIFALVDQLHPYERHVEFEG